MATESEEWLSQNDRPAPTPTLSLAGCEKCRPLRAAETWKDHHCRRLFLTPQPDKRNIISKVSALVNGKKRNARFIKLM